MSARGADNVSDKMTVRVLRLPVTSCGSYCGRATARLANGTTVLTSRCVELQHGMALMETAAFQSGTWQGWRRCRGKQHGLEHDPCRL
jgi:hypothetical protein